ncbi:MAG TPA: serine/threonine-protein kinase [Terriglobales bacterium]|nr:serine/threonine-protein kinase [Terriglobales bacterium]
MSTLHQSLGRYLIEAEIGRGAMGVVYRAYDPQIGRQVAIKTISLTGQEFADQQEYRARFLREVRAAGRLSHPGVVTIFDAGQDPEIQEPYLVMEYVTGEPLSRVLARQRKLNMPLALQYAQEIAEALDYAHNQGVVHRDIKPANILITEDGHAKIADFGVAWLRHEITQIGEVVGSPAYMAPEQMSGKQGDARSDLFSLGVVLYSMITGFRPFQGNSAKTVVFKVMNIEPVPVTSFQTEVSPELDAIVSRAIAKDPEDRYPSGAALARAIQKFRETGSDPTDTASFMTPSLHADAPRAGKKNASAAKLSMRYSLPAAILFVAIAGLLFAWRLANVRNVPLPADVIAELRLHPIRPHALTAAQTQMHAVEKARPRRTRVRKSSEASLPTAAPAASAKVQVEIQHHFNAARATLWVDDKLVSDQNLRGDDQKHSLLRTVEINQVTNFQFPAGKHSLQIRVLSPSNNYDQIETLNVDLAANSERVLSVNCSKRKMVVMLQ